MRILVTGGAGYIGSHFVKLLLDHNHQCLVIDDLSHGVQGFIPSHVDLQQIDIRKTTEMTKIIRTYRPDAIVHFAALASVAESFVHKDAYYDVNVNGTQSIIAAMHEANVHCPLVFSSSCSVYGSAPNPKVLETDDLRPMSPYAMTKMQAELFLRQVSMKSGLKVISLRYFNVAGADAQGQIGEMHLPETHLIPNVIEAVFNANPVQIFGSDYQTQDGTCERDYVHVSDVAKANLLAVTYAARMTQNFVAFNIGSGSSQSNLSIARKVSAVIGKKTDIVYAPRRVGDPDAVCADITLAQRLLNYHPIHSSLDNIVETAVRFYLNMNRRIAA
jgi:UDP-glucose 4-epimerase